MDNVAFLKDLKEKIKDNEPHFNVFALCIPCAHRWIGTVHYATSLFKLECPECKECDSFASIIPDDYIEANRE